MITIEQCRAARGLLDWTQQDLADASGLSKTAINNFEKGHSDIKADSLRAIRMAFETANVEFSENDGLRKRTESTKILKGTNAFSNLLDDIFETLKESGGEVLMSNIDESIIAQTSPKKVLQHLERLKDFNITQRVLCAEGSSTMLAPIASCRWLTNDLVAQGVTSFIYDKKVAFALWENSMIVVIDSVDAGQAERMRFENTWSTAQIPPSQAKFSQTEQRA